jgi:HSP20 family protein
MFYVATQRLADPSPRSPALDVAEDDRGYTVMLNLPGVGKEDIHVSVEGRRVSVEAQAPTPTPAPEDKPAAPRLVYRERAAARYSRQFTLPQEVDQAEVNARLEHGVLTLSLPKRSARTASQITVN